MRKCDFDTVKLLLLTLAEIFIGLFCYILFGFTNIGFFIGGLTIIGYILLIVYYVCDINIF